MIRPPALVHVRDLDGALRPALLLALRDGRSYVQVSRGAGDSVLRWLPSGRLAPASSEAVRGSAVPRREVHDGAVSWRPPRSTR
jgi:hypothetical protein